MSTTEQLKEGSGFLEKAALFDLAAEAGEVDLESYAPWLNAMLAKMRPLLVAHELIIRPDDRVWQCLYSPELALFALALVERHRDYLRVSVVDCVEFFEAFFQKDPQALRYLPRHLWNSRRYPITSLAPLDNVLPFRRKVG